MAPVRMVSRISLEAYSFVRSMSFSPITLPSRMPPALAVPKHSTVPKLRTSYLRVMSVTYLCWAIVEVYLSILRSIGQVTISMALNIVAFSLNILLNAVFIFGLFGAPKLGATGVAIATAPPADSRRRSGSAPHPS